MVPVSSSPRVVLLPIEPVADRYSEQWARWFPTELTRLGVPTTIIEGEVLDVYDRQGQFLDVVGTNHYKATQLAMFARDLDLGNISDGDWVLLLDGWDPAVLQLAYMRDLGRVKFKIASCWHAGSYDEWDLLGQHPTLHNWAAYAEAGMLSACDLVFAATGFHAEMLLRYRNPATSIDVTGFPMYSAEWLHHSRLWADRHRRVVWPHRVAPEKDPVEWDLIQMAYLAKYGDDGTEWVRTKDVAETKDAYYRILGDSRVAVSTAQQETWGIAMLEAASLGCYPVVPERLSYREVYEPEHRYTNITEAVEQIHRGLNADVAHSQNMRRWERSIAAMVDRMMEENS